ncbi:MAG: hypothetical protein ACE5KG_06040 [Nitrososphaerales archaeon]
MAAERRAREELSGLLERPLPPDIYDTRTDQEYLKGFNDALEVAAQKAEKYAKAGSGGMTVKKERNSQCIADAIRRLKK